MVKYFLLFLFFTSSLIAQENIPQENLVVILDNSGSMRTYFDKSNRIEAAKTALKTVLSKLPDNSRVGILLLNSINEAGSWIVPIDKIDREKINKQIDSVYAPVSGGTPLGQYIKIGVDKLLEVRQKEKYGNYQALVITDGEANDESLLDKYIPDIMTRGIKVNVIGVSLSNHTLAKKTSSYRSANDYASLTKALENVVKAETIDDKSNVDYSDIAGLQDEVAFEVIKTYADFDFSNRKIGEIKKIELPSTTSAPTEDHSYHIGLIGVVFSVFLLAFVIIIIFAIANS
jgi:hypothetical protein